MSAPRFFLCLLVFLAAGLPASAVTTLWTKILIPERGFSFKVGSDGTVAIVDGAISDVRKIYWIDRSGTVLRELIPPSQEFPHTPHYVSRDEIMLGGGGMALYQFVRHDQLELTRLGGGPTMHASAAPLSYPYYLERKALADGGVEFTLFDLTNPNTLAIVGDAVIGVHGKNLKVRWKSLVNAKYKVQYSSDLEIWTDYTEVLDGTGATLIVSIPIEEDAGSLYARVVKL